MKILLFAPEAGVAPFYLAHMLSERFKSSGASGYRGKLPRGTASLSGLGYAQAGGRTLGDPPRVIRVVRSHGMD